MGQNKTPLVGWHPKSADDLAWLDAEVERLGGGRGVRSGLLDEMLAHFIASRGGSTTARPAKPVPPPARTQQPQPKGAQRESTSEIMAALRRRRNGEQES